MNDVLDVARIEAAGAIADQILARKYCRDANRLAMAQGIEVMAQFIARLVVEVDALTAKTDGTPRVFSEGRPVPGAAACAMRTP